MLKLIGACLTLAACASFGFTWAGLYEKRPRQIKGLEGALQLLETEIIYGATPLPEAMEEVALRCDSEIAVLFRRTAGELRKMEGLTGGEAWQKAINDFFPGTALNKQDILILQRLGSSLGISDREDQAKHLTLTKSQLAAAAVQAEMTAKKSATVYRYLGVLGGLLLVLVLY
ncbi:MAG: stage III sporulation protein SpoIIIAB [Thermincola sp.]|jgi:stage III sporulation protein AB|nr:stage III sporulation protein SpoIIIAB [Thermincola sp.]MDT3703638.1 stage III sporulation protein SpoIIIAB [Thermincola sp.]